MRFFASLFSAAVLAATAAGCSDAGSPGAHESEANAVARPPQFVILAFDGSLNNDFWAESRAFAREANVKLTYFISGVYFIPNAQKRLYVGPHGNGPGASDIGFGGQPESITRRYDHVQGARDEGHEIGSHANGHFDGGRWTEADWTSEFEQFDEILFGRPHSPLRFGPEASVGFRAPLLAHSPGLYKTLAKRGYKYDTSKISAADAWPKQEDGIWQFPLASLRIVGSGKGTISMDFNFYEADSKAQPKPEGKEVFKKQMIDTYAKYFEGNYFGNRAPLHIGHHFSKWNGGAYWEAMQVFAKRVCGLPEVKCVTYSELMSFLNEKRDLIPSYQAGGFTKMPRPPSAANEGMEPLTEAELAEVMRARESHADEE
jgi:hypothetical protein